MLGSTLEKAQALTNSSEMLFPEGLTAEVTQFPEELGAEVASFYSHLLTFNHFCILGMGVIKFKL